MNDPLIGQNLAGQFQIEALVGSGGMGKVYRAFHEATDRYVAIKVLVPYPGGDEKDAIARFEREAQAVAALSHPNIVQMYDFGVTEDSLRYLVMEHLVGSTLLEELRAIGPLTPQWLAPVLTQIGDALDTAHRAGIVHRDLKPSNIFLAPGSEATPHVKLLDFGLAKGFSGDAGLADLTMDSVVVGTTGFLAPEQLLGGQLGPTTDIWALGVLTFQALTGRLPFIGEDDDVHRRSAMGTAPSPQLFREDLSDGVVAVVANALHRDPKKRPPTAGAYAQAFAQAAGGDDEGVGVTDQPLGDETLADIPSKRAVPATPPISVPPQRKSSESYLLWILLGLLGGGLLFWILAGS